ncbi:MAG TPA: MobF family relaxase [Opitutaceae bacterium]|nr:MobF family relaxase [Opitutaceae bacterium]
MGTIKNGANYLAHHLRRNDYWTEGEKEVQGEWIGEGANALGLAGPVTDEPFDALRCNRNPRTGEQLTARAQIDRVALFDIQLSAPKDVSVLAMVGNDDRVRTAFADSVKVVLAEMERFAAVRERRGEAVASEQFRLTGNYVGAKFLHDTSRDLDPQLHVHAVLANVTWDGTRNEWLAIQPAEMLRASPYLRKVLYRELAGRLRSLGYEPYEMNAKGFSVRGDEHLRERFSKRSRAVEQLAAEFAAEKGRRPTKREVEVLVRESRADKLTEVSTPEVRAAQRAELSAAEIQGLDDLVRVARTRQPREQWSHGMIYFAISDGIREGGGGMRSDSFPLERLASLSQARNPIARLLAIEALPRSLPEGVVMPPSTEAQDTSAVDRTRVSALMRFQGETDPLILGWLIDALGVIRLPEASRALEKIAEQQVQQKHDELAKKAIGHLKD